MNKSLIKGLVFIILCACSYEPILQNKKYDFQFVNIYFEGDNKINNIIKNEKYPPYNIKIEKNNLYIIEVSVAGFTEDELLVTINDNHLVIKSIKNNSNYKKNYLHKGIASRNFEKTFKLSKNINIDKCYLIKGILNIPLQLKDQIISEPKTIKIEKY